MWQQLPGTATANGVEDGHSGFLVCCAWQDGHPVWVRAAAASAVPIRRRSDQCHMVCGTSLVLISIRDPTLFKRALECPFTTATNSDSFTDAHGQVIRDRAIWPFCLDALGYPAKGGIVKKADSLNLLRTFMLLIGL